MSRLLIVRGIPGSGKSTYIRDNHPHLLNLETDEFNIVDGEYCFTQERLKTAIDYIHTIFNTLVTGTNKPDFCLAGVFTAIPTFDYYVLKAIANGYKVYIKTLTTQFKCVHPVPDRVIENMKNSFVPHSDILCHYALNHQDILDKIFFDDMPWCNIDK